MTADRPPARRPSARDRTPPAPSAWIDVTRSLSTATPPWPGDTPFSLAWTVRMDAGEPVNVSAIRLSPHVGTHADAPLHFDREGQAVGELPLDVFVGRARVVRAPRWDELAPGDLPPALTEGAERLLLRMPEPLAADRFPERIAYPSLALARRLAAEGCRLFGTEAPSVEGMETNTLAVHRALAEAGVAILENLDLSRVEPGDYELVALPLRMPEAEASPVRAVLRPLA